MLEIIKQLALDVAENGADFCVGTVKTEVPLIICLEEGLELTEQFLIQMENTLAGSAATALPRTPTASAPAMPPFCMPTSMATVRASVSPRCANRPTSLVSQ